MDHHFIAVIGNNNSGTKGTLEEAIRWAKSQIKTSKVYVYQSVAFVEKEEPPVKVTYVLIGSDESHKPEY